MSISITLPTGMSLRAWTDRVCLDLDPFLAVGRLMDEKKWKQWGYQFLGITTLPQPMPDPTHFKDWRKWADAFVYSLS